MGIFREFNRVIRSGAFALNSVIRNKERQGRASIRMWTSLTIFATNLVDFGSSVVRKATGKPSNKSKKPKKEKKEKQERVDNRYKYDENREKTLQEFSKINKQEESTKTPDIYDKIYADEDSTNVNYVSEEYQVVLENMEKMKIYFNYRDSDGLKFNNSENRYYINLYSNISKRNWGLFMNNEVDGKHISSYSPEEREKFLADFQQINTRDLIKKSDFSFDKFGIYDDKGLNYLQSEFTSPSDILSALSVDYGKNYVPLFVEVLNNISYLNNQN